MSSDSTKKTIIVALGICLVCSILVSSAAVALSKIQEENKELDKITNILLAGDLMAEGKPVREIYKESVVPILIDLNTGEAVKKENYPEKINIETFSIKNLVSDPELSERIDPKNDIADIKRKPKYMVIYEVFDGDKVDKFILPIYGKGLWSTLYGFIAIDSDLQTIKGLTFYEHGETPGLGGEIDNPKWKNSWKGKQAFNDEGKVIIQVIKGIVDQSSPASNHQIDGLSGSTITTRGVDYLVNFWLGENGYGPFFEKLKGEAHEQV
ncbi:MAG: Na(+)-translocating NADH-quinone reductase subunit C [Ignavibacteriae bacterium]|jgi:Na+-transporting NADH:ubiquinone oxidoreductase subunit C|nr:Na(+)-translocating NADH-quinone reductase subunit C [Ignavibacteriota bacterium]NOG97688.1 Na(+)-translocating NADH-quinone reductase subunit C [Ignavibacteriota bacterium]